MSLPAGSPKLNLFALPSQTAVLFALIVGVILAAVVSGAIGPSPLCVTPILLGVLALPLRAYLAWPEREIARYKLRPADEACAPLQAEIAVLSKQIGLPSPPRLMVTDRPLGLYTFGSFRRRYIAAGIPNTQSLITSLSSPATAPQTRAVLLHELAHFKNGDIWQMGYARELLRTVAVFLSWSAAFFVGLIILIMMLLPSVLEADFLQPLNLDPGQKLELEQWLGIDPATRAQVAQRVGQINPGLVASFVCTSLWPLIIVGLVLWAFYWRKLLRIRELYADARAAQVLGETQALQQAIIDYSLELSLPVRRPSLQPRTAPASLVSMPLAFIGRTVNVLWKTHPRLNERLECLRDPNRVFGSWQSTALMVGIFVLLLDVLLVSPFTSYYLSSFPMHFATLAAFVTVAVSLLPGVVSGRRMDGDVARIVAVVIALRIGWLALNIGLAGLLYLVSPEMLQGAFRTLVYSSARYAGQSVVMLPDAGSLLVEAALVQLVFQIGMGLALLIFLYADVRLKRRVFTWYACQRIVAVCWGVTALLAFVLGTVVLIPLTALIMNVPETLLNTTSLSLIVFAIIAAVVSAGLYVWADQRYGRRCPKCGARVAGSLERCSQCNEMLYSWLIANY